MMLFYWIAGGLAAWVVCYGLFLVAMALPVWVLLLALAAVVLWLVK